jgi:DNA adenine methylase
VTLHASYPGGKGASGVAQTIINQQPPHDVYIEPFLGGGAVMRAKRPAKFNCGIDLDPGPIAKFRELSWPGFVFLHADSLLALDPEFASFPEGRTLIYADPPYPLSSRRRNRRLYRCELTDQEHRNLLALLVRQSARHFVQISSYWNPLYAEMLEGWRLVRFMANTRGGLMEECLWMNYPEPQLLHDYRYLGSDYRERERIKRKTARWSARIAALPQLERVALLSAMQASSGENGAAGSRVENADVRRPEPAAPAMPAVTDRLPLDQTGGSVQ